MAEPKTVLLACELGGGMGHIDPLLRIAKGLAAEGHRPVLAVRNLSLAWPKARETSFPLMQAPVFFWRTSAGGVHSSAGYADTLVQTGFESVDTLMPLIRGWEALLEDLRPSLIIADYSPVVTLAVYRKLPVLNVGFGFIVPPTNAPTFPPLVPNKPDLVPQQDVLNVIQAVQRLRGQPEPETLTGVFAEAEPFLTVLPQLDHYVHVQRQGHLGPMVELLPPQPWPDQPRFFAYLKATNPKVENLLSALGQSGYAGKAFVLGASADVQAKLSRSGVEILSAPTPINEVLPHVNVVIHHAGINMSQQALAAGRPQLLFPEHLEGLVTAARLHALGVAHYALDDIRPRIIQQGLRELMMQPNFRDSAMKVAKTICESEPWDPLPRILERCRQLLA